MGVTREAAKELERTWYAYQSRHPPQHQPLNNAEIEHYTISYFLKLLAWMYPLLPNPRMELGSRARAIYRGSLSWARTTLFKSQF